MLSCWAPLRVIHGEINIKNNRPTLMRGFLETVKEHSVAIIPVALSA